MSQTNGTKTSVAMEGAGREKTMTISFEIPREIEQQIRTSGVDLGRDAKEVYLMEQYRQARITHRQLEEALDLSFHETEQLLKDRDMGQDMDSDEFEANEPKDTDDERIQHGSSPPVDQRSAGCPKRRSGCARDSHTT